MSSSMNSQALPRELVLASAGSGKTYHLSSRIIGLLARGTPPDEILASTFTRKAAGEILERVLVRLAEGASDAGMAQELGRDADPCLSQPDACRGLLARLLTNLHQMNVGTLDAFFTRVARSFFQELGLAPGWTIADQPTQERLRTEAVHTVLAGTNRAELVAQIGMLNRGDAKRQVHDALLEKVDTLLRIRRQLDPEAVDPWSPAFVVTEQLSPEEVKAKAADLAARLGRLEVPTTRDGTPTRSWVKARNDAAAAIATLDWEAGLGKGIGAKVLQKEGLFDSKPIESEFVDVFLEVGALARIELALRLRRETEAMGRLAGLLETSFENAQRHARAYRFEDVTYLLGGADATGRRDDLLYRLDQRVRHLLLDEFQDTSLEQWRALKPFAHELLSGNVDERAGVIVADTKQYGLAATTLDKSWRSSAVILDFVANVFRGLQSNAVVSGIPVGPDVASDWMRDFTELEAARDLPGHVCVHLAPNDTGTATIQPKLLHHAVEVVKALHDEMPGRSIGVLVRRNKVLGYLMDELRALGIHASGEGAASLTDTPPANALLSLLRLADHPQDRTARYHVARTPLGEVVGFTDYEEEHAARALAYRVRARLLREGYGPALANWVHELAPRCDAREVLRLLAIARARMSGMPDDQVAGLIADFRGWMAAEPIRSALSRDGFPSEPDTVVHVENERPFVRRVGDEIQEGFIDRLVLIQREGRVVRAEILDFKTDTIDPDNEEILVARAEHYRPQIVAYCDVVREQYGLAEGDVSGKLAFLGTGVVREVV